MTESSIIDAIAYHMCLAVHHTVISSALFHVLSAMERMLPPTERREEHGGEGIAECCVTDGRFELNLTCLKHVAYSDEMTRVDQKGCEHRTRPKVFCTDGEPAELESFAVPGSGAVKLAYLRSWVSRLGLCRSYLRFFCPPLVFFPFFFLFFSFLVFVGEG